MRRLIFGGGEVPDFTQIPRERWEEVMRGIPMALRSPAAQNLGLPFDEVVVLQKLAMADLPPAPSDLARAVAAAKPQLAPRPAVDAFRRATRQVNFRLTEEEYLDLGSAAETIGTTPTGLAGQLVRNGVRRILQEIDSEGSRRGS